MAYTILQRIDSSLSEVALLCSGIVRSSGVGPLLFFYIHGGT